MRAKLYPGIPPKHPGKVRKQGAGGGGGTVVDATGDDGILGAHHLGPVARFLGAAKRSLGDGVAVGGKDTGVPLTVLFVEDGVVVSFLGSLAVLDVAGIDEILEATEPMQMPSELIPWVRAPVMVRTMSPWFRLVSCSVVKQASSSSSVYSPREGTRYICVRLLKPTWQGRRRRGKEPTAVAAVRTAARLAGDEEEAEDMVRFRSLEF